MRRNWVKELRAATATFNWPVVTELAHSYAAHLYAAPSLPSSIGPVLQELRQTLRYTELELVADAALAHGPGLPVVRRQYAQALVDIGKPAAALALYSELASDEMLAPVERDEARGGVGRCYKELFLACTEPSRRRRYLTLSLDAYLAAYRADPEHTWHGINAAALLARADRDGIEVPQMPAAAELAGAVLKTVDAAGAPDSWTEVTACEAAIALRRYDEAIERAEAFIESKPHGFTVAAFHRQLRTVWQLDTASDPGSELLAQLRSALLDRVGGHVTVEPEDVRIARLDMDLQGGRLERILGVDRFQSLTWYRNGLLRCRAVASVQTPSGDAVGTGFLVAGPELHPDLPPLVLVTNGHVVPEGLRPDDTVLAFHGIDDHPVPRARFRVKRLCWHQPSAQNGLDTAILEPHGHPPGVAPVPLAAELPSKPLDHRRAYVIGHPRGLSQPQFSLQDNLLLDYDRYWVHYRCPTEAGSSGSPVFDDDWHLIGLHHLGGNRVKRLNGAAGTYAANEGITIDAIRRALVEEPPTAREP